jgi:(1->4)-alpha-D-glucan 1-alpha-D-glucosylmutase
MLDEVGGAPERFAVEPDELYAALAAAPPDGLLATSTHDTKRGEDVRARLAVLSEIADTWSVEVGRWSERARRYRPDAVDRPTEYLLWQTLVGAWPLTIDRLRAYLEKAAREAKRNTSWLSPNPGYEEALFGFAAAILEDRELSHAIATFVASLAPCARRNALTRTLLKLTAPGVPDLYQGTELWDFSLVDPDNRRPVDFDARRAMLRRVRDLGPEDAMTHPDDGAPKLWLTHRVLQLRRRQPELFEGAARALPASGPRADGVIAFARGERLVAIAPRLTARGLAGADTTIELPPGAWIDALSGDLVPANGKIGAAAAWARFPVALLARRA